MARSFVPTLFFMGAGALLLAGCGESKPVSSTNTQFKPADVAAEGTKSADKTEKAPAAVAQENGQDNGPDTAQPKPISVDRLDADSLPEGPPAAIVAFMKQLDGYEGRGVTREAQRADLIRVLRLMMEAGDRVLVDEASTPEQRREAAQLKLQAVANLARRGEPKADEEMLAYAQRLLKDKDVEISRMGRTMLFGSQVAKLQNGDIEDPQAIIDDLKVLLEGEDPDHVVFMLGNQAAMTLNQLGHNAQAATALTMLGNKYKTDKDENVAAQAQQLLKQTKLIELDFRGKLTKLFEEKADPKAADELVATVKTLLEDKDAGTMELSVASQTADILERTEHYDAAKAVIEQISTRFADSTDEKLAADAKETVEDSQKRLGLIGQPLEVTGKNLDGTPFDTASLKGKIVLVDFWATWCGPCLEEIPNIKKYYDLYKEKGFEVIGYNLDDKAEDVERFFATQKLPWATITSPDEKKVGFSSPLAEQCGVKSIPFLVLLDGEGKVLALHTRGEKLGEKLAQLLGPVEGADAAPAEEKKAE